MISKPENDPIKPNAANGVGLILAGGRSTRMGGRDKAWVTVAGKPLLAHAVSRLAVQVSRIAVNSNAPPELFADFGLPVLADRFTGYAGPLAGIHTGLMEYPADWLIAVAVDLLQIPEDLVMRLQAGLGTGACAYATDGKRHALALLFRPGTADLVRECLEGGEYRVGAFLARHGRAVLFNRPQDRGLFTNLNTPKDVAEAERELEAK